MKFAAAAMLAAFGLSAGAAQPTPAEPAPPASQEKAKPALPPGAAFVTPAVEEPLKATPAQALETIVSEAGPDTGPAGAQPMVRFPGLFSSSDREDGAAREADVLPPELAAALSGEIGWAGPVDVRRSVLIPATNWIYQTRPVLPRVTRPERRGFGGFMAAFANLFNPLAPVEEGTATSGEHWYDAQINIGPLPRVMRDERFHEPTTQFLRVGLEEPDDPRE